MRGVKAGGKGLRAGVRPAGAAGAGGALGRASGPDRERTGTG
ncbi:hypothetical protein [Streptomyces sp. NPDC048392]